MSELLTLQEVGRILRIGPEAIRLWIKDGIFEGIRTPGKRPLYRVKGEILDALLNTSSQNKQEGAAQP